ncbi:MBL fold metallo-hydrolase [Desulfothermus okinawensis JCM 13304]
MKIKFLGAARTVTGCCFRIELNGHKFCIDCGLHQGNKEIEERNYNTDLYGIKDIEFILLSHCHIDHSGLIPKFVKDGFNGDIYTTHPTMDLLTIMLKDSAHVQATEIEWKNQKRKRQGKPLLEPLYSEIDADNSIPLMKTTSYDKGFSPIEGLEVQFHDAGHILGSSIIELDVKENNKEFKVVFSGDLGRPKQFIVKDPTKIEYADFLFVESTYGSRLHKNEEASLDELAEAINYSISNNEKTIIPAFAVERTQEILYSLYFLIKQGKIPDSIPVYMDSPLAINATKIFDKYHSYFDEESKELFKKGENPLKLPNIKFALSTEDSIQLNSLKGPAIIISASGMANAGRIKHHLKHNIWKPGVSIVFVGFQAQGTLGRRIVDGAKSVKIFGEETQVKARVFTINGFSAHADQKQILEWIKNFKNPKMKVFLVHGEYESQKVLAEKIKEQFGFDVYIPDYLEEYELVPEAVTSSIREEDKKMRTISVDWDFLIEDLKQKIMHLEKRKQNLSSLDLITQSELRDEILEASYFLSKLISSTTSS